MDSLAGRSLEKQFRSGANCPQDQGQLCLDSSFTFPRPTADDSINDVGLGVPEGCLANVSASLV